jgi:hypothetical protein
MPPLPAVAFVHRPPKILYWDYRSEYPDYRLFAVYYFDSKYIRYFSSLYLLCRLSSHRSTPNCPNMLRNPYLVMCFIAMRRLRPCD